MEEGDGRDRGKVEGSRRNRVLGREREAGGIGEGRGKQRDRQCRIKHYRNPTTQTTRKRNS